MFISSTFSDMHAERDHLVKVVFPVLREHLQKYRVHLVDVDLRWGLTQEQCDHNKATELCLQQVNECRPFFLCILGERYGYIPSRFPKSTLKKYPWLHDYPGVSVTALEVIASIFDECNFNKQTLFFFRDGNFIGLVPDIKRVEVDAENNNAAQKLAVLKELIRRKSLGVPLVENYHCSYRGLRVNPRLVSSKLVRRERKVFENVANDGLVEPAEYAKLDEHLREFINRHGVVYSGGLETFGQRVQERLWDAIRLELKLPDAISLNLAYSDPLTMETELHDLFMESRLRMYVERKRIQQLLKKYISRIDPRPILLIGPSGSGKSAIMAWLVQAMQSVDGSWPELSGSVNLVIPHFVGASPESTSLRKMLKRFCLILRQRFTSSEEVKTKEQQEVTSILKPPEQTDKLIEEFWKLIQFIPQQDQVIFVIDGLNQLDAIDNAHSMHWLPRNLPANIKVIMSCISQPEEIQIHNESRISKNTSNIHQVLAYFRHRSHRRINVTPLTNKERLRIIHEIPSLSSKILDKKQILLLMNNPATCNPLFLFVSLEELRGFGSFEQLEARINNFPNKGDTLTEIFQQVIERLEEEFGLKLVQRVLSFLACSRNGLSEQELKELIDRTGSANENSIGVSSSMYAILRQIRPYTQYRGELLDFFHHSFLNSVHHRYLNTSKKWREANAILAEYFLWKADPDGKKDWTGDYPRGLSELPFHLTEAGDNKSLLHVLTDFGFLQAKLLKFDSHSLIEDFDIAINCTVKMDLEEKKILELLRDALRLSIDQLASDSSQLLSQLWGRLVYEESTSIKSLLQSFKVKATKPWLQLWTQSLTAPGSLIWQANIEIKWRQYGQPKVCLTSGANEIIVACGDGSLLIFKPNSNLPLIELGGKLQSGVVIDAVITGQGRSVTVSRKDGSVDVWNLEDQALERTNLRFHPSALIGKSYAMASDGDLLILGMVQGSVEFRQLSNSAFHQKLEGHNCEVSAVAISSNANRAIAAYIDGTLKVWDLKTGKGVVSNTSSGSKVLTVGKEHWNDYGSFGKSPANALAITSDGKRALIGNEEKIFSNNENSAYATEDIRGLLSQWDLQKEVEVSSLEAYSDSRVFDLDISPDNRFIVTLSEHGVLKLWDLSKPQIQMMQHYESDPIVAVTPDGHRVLSISDDGFLKVWELTTGKLHCLRGVRDPAFDLKVSADSRFAIVVSAGYCVIWNLESLTGGKILGNLPQTSGSGGPPKVWVKAVAPLPSGNKVITVTSDGLVTTCNLAEGKSEHKHTKITGPIWYAAIDPAGAWMLYTPDRRRLILHNLSRIIPDRHYQFNNSQNEVTKLLAPLEDGGLFIELNDGSIWVWNPKKEKPELWPDSGFWKTICAMTPDGNYALSYRGDELSLFNLRTNAKLATFTAEAAFSSLALSMDGRVISASDVAKRVHILLLEIP